MASEIEREARERAEAPSSLGDILEGVQNVPGTNWTYRVTRAWFAVNGDTERQHTVGTFVAPPRRAGALPVLVVYVDSKSCEVDFMANREVYLARLAQAGLSFSEVHFKQSKRPAPDRSRRAVEAPAPELPQLSAEEERGLEELLANVPEELRASVSQAVRVSMRAEKRRNS